MQLAPKAANKGATTRPAGGLIEPMTWTRSSIDRQAERGRQTKNSHSNIKIFTQKKAAARRGRQAWRELLVLGPHYSLRAFKWINLF